MSSMKDEIKEIAQFDATLEKNLEDFMEAHKIVDEVEDSHLKVVKCKDGYYDLDNFIKSSPNIIDLIEVGDYVNGHRVIDITKDQIRALYYEDINQKYALIPMINKDIKSIVTKEQFESMQYKVGE